MKRAQWRQKVANPFTTADRDLILTLIEDGLDWLVDPEAVESSGIDIAKRRTALLALREKLRVEP